MLLVRWLPNRSFSDLNDTESINTYVKIMTLLQCDFIGFM